MTCHVTDIINSEEKDDFRMAYLIALDYFENVVFCRDFFLPLI